MSAPVVCRKEILLSLDFQLNKEGKKYTALCLYCKKKLSNVATQRLIAHRNICKKTENTIERDQKTCAVAEFEYEENRSDQNQTSVLEVDDDNTAVEILMDITNSNTSFNVSDPCQSLSEMQKYCFTARASSALSTTTITSPTSKISVSPVPSTSSVTSSNQENVKIPAAKDNSSQTSHYNFKHKKDSGPHLKHFLDSVSKREEEEINELIGKFFYGCNIPLSVIDSNSFKDLVKKLRPAYAQVMPTRRTLSTTLLDKEYKRQIEKGKALIGLESVLLIDGWKNTASNSKTVVTMLHNANGQKVFLNAWDLSGESETAERLSEIVHESIELAFKMYNTKVYAVVSDNAAAMIKMGKTVNIWHSNCSAHVANLLIKSVLDKKLVENVTTILKEFRHVDLEKRILENGGTRIKIPCETRWCSHYDCFVCLQKNLTLMRQVVALSKNKIKQNVKKLLFDDEFIEGVEESIKLMDPICTLVNKVQSSNCSVADAVNLWLTLTLPEEPEIRTKFENRTKQALNLYALSAYYLHPYYSNENLTTEQKETIVDFLLNTLDGQGVLDLDAFLNLQGHFNLLIKKDLKKDPFIFWRMASIKYPSVSALALKLLSIPASSAQIERLFSNWAYIHSDVRNRLTFERSKKLVHIYYNIKINEKEPIDDFELY